jgi:hypothetical protein
MREDGVHRHLVALNDVEHAVRQAGLLVVIRQAQGEGGVLLRRLEDEGVAAGDRHRRHPQGDHRREIERRDSGDHAERLPNRMAIDAAAYVFGEFALEEMRNAAGELHHLDAAGDRALGVRHGLAVFLGEQRRQLVDIAFQQILQAEQHPRASERRCRCPGGKGRLGRRHGGIDFLFRGEGNLAD